VQFLERGLGGRHPRLVGHPDKVLGGDAHQQGQDQDHGHDFHEGKSLAMCDVGFHNVLFSISISYLLYLFSIKTG
jgi:hypothetical protein